MADNRNFAALEWVSGEIEETLTQARQALEAYVADPQDVTRIRFCLTHIHQVHGSLKMVEFYGAALMAEEMESLTSALMNDSVENIAEAQEVLMRAILQFPLYLEKVKQTRRDHPVLVLPLLNDLRAVRGESLLTETKLFSPNLAASRQLQIQRLPQSRDDKQFLPMLQKLSKMYQLAAAGVLHNVKLEENLAYIAKVFERLDKLTQGTAKQSLWRVSQALIQGLINDSIDASASVKNLLRQINREIKILLKHGVKALDVAAPDELLKNMLYYVATAGEAPDSNSVQAEVYQQYRLSEAMPEGGEIASAEAEPMLSAPDPETMRSVVVALKDELDNIKHLLDMSLRGVDDNESTIKALPVLQRVADTMAVLDLGHLRNQVLFQHEILEQAISGKASLNHDLLMSVAGSIIELENSLEVLATGTASSAEVNAGVDINLNLNQAQATVLRESRNGLERTKDAIIEYISSQWNSEHLESVPKALHEIRGGLDMIPLHRPAKILGACARYIEEQLLARELTPDWATLDTLADAITSVEYYLERIAGERREDDELLLGVAEESVEALGYAVTGSGIRHSEALTFGSAEADASRVGMATAEPLETAASTIEPDAESVLGKMAVVEDIEMVSVVDEDNKQPDNLSQESTEPEFLQFDEPIGDVSSEGCELDSEDDFIAADQAIEQGCIAKETTKVVSEGASEGVVEDDDEDEIDEEILEIFVEEAEEVCETIAEFFPVWMADNNDEEALTEFRRAFHTLKGSGRMVGALDIGELAWSVENMLNRLIDGTVSVSAEMCELIESVRLILPSLIRAFNDRAENPQKVLCERYQAIADALSKGPLPEHLSIDSFEIDGTKEDIKEEDDDDAVLWEIFGTEALGHLQVVQAFIDEMVTASPLYSPPSDAMQRALHTLKGSAHMAGVTPIAKLATPLESFVKELRSYQVNIDEDILQLLRDGVSYTRIALEKIERREDVLINQLPQFSARVAELRELHVAPLVRQKEISKDGELKIDPQLLEIFMAEEMNLLLDADQLIDTWIASQNSSGSGSLQPLQHELLTLQYGATHANLLEMAALSDQLHQIYVAVHKGVERVDIEPLGQVLKAGHNALLDMVDAVAAGQNLPPLSEALHEDLRQIIDRISGFAYEDESVVSEVVDVTLDASVVDDLDPALDITDAESDDLDIAVDGLNIIEGQDTSEVAEVIVADDALDEVLDDDALDSDIKGIIIDDNALDDAPLDKETETETETEAETERAVESSTELSSAPNSETETASVFELPEDFDEDIVEIFLEEANELLEDLEHAIHAWESDWSDSEPVDELKRILHTFKGGARMSGMKQAGDISHDFETMLINHHGDADSGMISKVHQYQDQLIHCVENISALLAGEAPVALEVNISEPAENADRHNQESYVAAATDKDSTIESQGLENTKNTGDAAAVNSDKNANVIPFVGKSNQAGDDGSAGSFVPSPGGGNSRELAQASVAAPQLAARRSAPQEVVKVSAELLEELVNLAGETSITRGRMEEQVTDLGGAIDEMESTIQRLQDQLRRLDIETEAQISFRQEQLSEQEEFDPLEMDRYSSLQQLSRSLIESASDLMDLKATLAEKNRDSETLLLQQSRINTELQEGLMRSRMVPFSRLVPRLRRIVRQVATELGKQVSFELDNVEGELDRSVLERMVAPLEHMLRNAVDHGIETPEQRLAANKPEAGRVVLSLSREGGEVVLRLVDDGRGIDIERVKAKAVERGLIKEDSLLSDQDIMQFILHAGFSTAESVTQISGRGVGMDVVNSEIKQLGGIMLINSRWGQGSEFTVRLPFTVSVNRALMVQIGDDRYAIPLNTIEGIVRVSPFELEHYYQDEQARFEYAGENYQVRYLGAMLNSGARPKLEDQVLPLPVVLVRSAEHTVAVQVDRLMGSREIVVKTLGPQFSNVMGLSGATVMGDGSVVVILDPHAMIRKEAVLASADTQLLEPLEPQAEEEKSTIITVMVVDDSVTVRKVTTRFLEREGYSVLTAKDGREALVLLQDHIPDVMLLDIEMPRMDGFEVAKNIRSSSRLKDLPIIMITSRTGDKHRLRAMDLGVNKYMGKPFQEDILLGNIRALSGEVDQS